MHISDNFLLQHDSGCYITDYSSLHKRTAALVSRSSFISDIPADMCAHIIM